MWIFRFNQCTWLRHSERQLYFGALVSLVNPGRIPPAKRRRDRPHAMHNLEACFKGMKFYWACCDAAGAGWTCAGPIMFVCPNWIDTNYRARMFSLLRWSGNSYSWVLQDIKEDLWHPPRGLSQCKWLPSLHCLSPDVVLQLSFRPYGSLTALPRKLQQQQPHARKVYN